MPCVLCFNFTKNIYFKGLLLEMRVKKIKPTKLPYCMFCVAISTQLLNLLQFVG